MYIIRYFVPFFMLLLLHNSLVGQEKYCDTDVKMDLHDKIHPFHKKNIKESFNFFSKNPDLENRSLSTSKVIPVHVIVVHKPRQPIGEGGNIPNNLIIDQIEALNRDFNRENGDSINTPAMFSRSKMDVVFCLAKIDPFGKPTDGITRYATSLPFEANEFTIKESSGWARQDYLNIWVTELDGKLGFAYIPALTSLPDEILDGVVLDYRVVGNGIANPRFGLGRVAVHEVGHYLGLQHVYASKGCADDDGIEDTPRQDSARVGCPTHPSISCGNQGDMFMNYMDNANDSCKNAFTKLQVDYMNAILNSVRQSVTLSVRSPECSRIAPLVVMGSATTLPKCAGDKTGSIEIFTQGGRGPYRYFLENKESSSNIFRELTAGVYRVKVIDAVGNVDSARYTIFEPDSLDIKLESFVYSGCSKANDSLTIKVNGSGGVVNFIGYNFTLGNETNRTGRFTKVNAGVNKILIRDFNNCTDSLVLDVPQKLYLDTIPTLVKFPTCRGDVDGQIRVLAPSPTFQYFIDNKSIKDGNLPNLSPGSYEMKVISDRSGCVYEKKISIIDPPVLKIDDVLTQQVPCVLPDTSSILIMASGGLGGYQYAIDSIWKNGNTFKGVGTGVYDVKIRDINGCTLKYNRTVAVTQVGGMFGMFDAFDAFCDDNSSGRIVLNASGGSGSYNYYLNGNVSSRDIRNLKPGSYNVTIEDRVSRCLQNRTLQVKTQAPMRVNIQQTIINPNQTVQIVFAVQGGLPPYLYSIDNGASFKSVPIFDQLPSGTYTITVIDNNNCKVNITVKLTSTFEEQYGQILTYPNPFADVLRLELPEGVTYPVDISLYDLNGRMIKTSTYDNKLIEINDLGELKSGVYILNVLNETAKINMRVVKY